MIHVIAEIELVENRRSDFLEEFHKIVPLVREEEGCLEYGPTIDLETNISAQPAARPHTVVVVEKWRDLDALEKHLIAPHMLQYRNRVKDLVAGATIHILQPA
jgi:quinol monooxygenase YgiN